MKKWLKSIYRKIKPARTFWTTVAIVYLTALFVIIMTNSDMKLLGTELSWNWGRATFWTLCFYTLLSLRVVKEDEVGARLFFRRPLHNLSSGLVFIPLGFCQIVKETRLIMQDELPAPPEKIWRTKKGKRGEASPEADVVPADKAKEGYKPPIRITFGAPNVELPENTTDKVEQEQNIEINKHIKKIREAQQGENGVRDPFDFRMTAEVFLIIRWRIDDFVRFISTIGTIDKARTQIEDTATAAVTRAFAKISPAVALAHLGTQSKYLRAEIEERISGKGEEKKRLPWGIKMETAQIKLINFSHEFNDAVQERAEAEAIAQVKATEGKGEGDKEKRILTGRADGLKHMAKELGVSSAAVLASETARAITQNPGQKTIIAGSGGLADLMGVVTALGQTLGGDKNKTQEKKGDTNV
ncbi:MAG: hypothetical protein G01um101417_62 [Parcubacteria group bacterium Gr01-1014_17]|nr:MAG: hypothetical protein G01um101417_62 [Parcubacteria group bacterium Gr01-1014_17]